MNTKVVAQDKKTIVRTAPHDLQKIIKSLSKESQKAVEKLSKLCDSQDEKIALEASKALLACIKDMSGQVTREALQLLLVQSKMNAGRIPVQEDNTPRICFDEIQEM